MLSYNYSINENKDHRSEDTIYDFYYGEAYEDIIKHFNIKMYDTYTWSCRCDAKYNEQGEVIKTPHCDCGHEEIVDYMFYELELDCYPENPEKMLIDTGYQYIFKSSDVENIKKVVDDCTEKLKEIFKDEVSEDTSVYTIEDYINAILNSHCKADSCKNSDCFHCKENSIDKILQEKVDKIIENRIDVSKNPKLKYFSLIIFGRNILKSLESLETLNEIVQVFFKPW